MNKPKKIQVTLTLTLLVESNSMSQEEMCDAAKEGLTNLVGLGEANGVLTGNYDMEVAESDTRIEYKTGSL